MTNSTRLYLLIIIALALVVVLLTYHLVVAIQMYHHERDRDRCSHQWYVTGATYTPPTSRGFETSGFSDRGLINRLIHGFTTITQRCSHCHVIRTERKIGKVQIPGRKWTTEKVA